MKHFNLKVYEGSHLTYNSSARFWITALAFSRTLDFFLNILGVLLPDGVIEVIRKVLTIVFLRSRSCSFAALTSSLSEFSDCSYSALDSFLDADPDEHDAESIRIEVAEEVSLIISTLSSLRLSLTWRFSFLDSFWVWATS